MKKILLRMIIIMLLSFISLQGKRIDNYENLSISMQVFNNISSDCYAEKKHFAVKVLKAEKTASENVFIYKYDVAFAPLIDERLDIRLISFLNNETVEKLFFNNGQAMPITNTIDSYFDGIVLEDSRSFEAFEWIITKSISADWLNKSGITENQLDKYMSDIRLAVVFNGISEEFDIKCNGFSEGTAEYEYRFGVLQP